MEKEGERGIEERGIEGEREGKITCRNKLQRNSCTSYSQKF